jgi:signal transduction histidine kinase
MRDNYRGLYECYLSAGDIKQALHYHVLLFDVEKKLLDVENNKQLAILQISFDTERKEIDNRILKKDNELKEMTIKRESAFLWLFVAALGFSFLLSILIYTRFKNKQKANRILEDLNYKVRKQNETLELLNHELEKANQEKDIMFSIITHELRNPLYWFQNLAQMLSKKYQSMSPDKVRKTLNALDESAKNAFHLMDNLLNW